MLFDHLTPTSQQLALDDLIHTRTWAELHHRVLRLASLIRAEQVQPGEHIAVLLRNRVEYVELVLAGLLTGVWLTPINWHLTADEVLYIINDSGACRVFSEDFFAAVLEPSAVEFIDVDQLDLAVYEPFVVDFQAAPGGVMMYTSGTTGKPKGVKRGKPETLQALLQQHSTIGNSVGLDGNGCHLVTGPLYHAAPLLYALYDLANGAPMVIMPRFDAQQAMSLMRDRAVSHSHWVPTMFVRALRDKQQFANGFPELTLLLHGAAPISVDLKQQMIAWWGPVLNEYWGGTESGVVTQLTSEQWLANPGSVGKPLPQFEVYAAAADGRRLDAGEQGLLCIRHKTLPQAFAYHHAPQKTADSFVAPGVFTIGDIGYLDQQGYVYLLDRESHMIISGGVNIYPAEIESLLQSHPAVNDVAVFGVPNDEWGEEVKAVIELESSADLDHPSIGEQLGVFCAQHLAAYKRPRSFEFVDALPRFDSGKLAIRSLKAQYWDD